jgi:hypothetical protein
MRILDDDEAIYSHWAIAEASAKDRSGSHDSFPAIDSENL